LKNNIGILPKKLAKKVDRRNSVIMQDMAADLAISSEIDSLDDGTILIGGSTDTTGDGVGDSFDTNGDGKTNLMLEETNK
jgi:hypothetical protein